MTASLCYRECYAGRRPDDECYAGQQGCETLRKRLKTMEIRTSSMWMKTSSLGNIPTHSVSYVYCNNSFPRNHKACPAAPRPLSPTRLG